MAESVAPARASRVGSALGLAGSTTGGIGVRMAFEPGHGRTAVPVRSALAGTVVAITAVVAALGFGASLIGLVGTPHRYGQNWDQELDLGFAGVSAAAGARLVAAEPAVTGYAAGDYGQLTLDGKLVAAIGIGPFPGTGCVNITCYSFFLLRYRPGTNLNAMAARLTAAARTAIGCPPGPESCSVTADQRPTDIKSYASVRDTPLVLGAVLALLAVATLAHVLLTGVRRRRRDLAVLKTLGLTRSQVIRVVSWQATALAAAALLVGLPLGVLAGRWAWALFAGSAGVSAQAEIPVPLVLAIIPAALLLANLIAAGPGWTAARIRPALALRSE